MKSVSGKMQAMIILLASMSLSSACTSDKQKGSSLFEGSGDVGIFICSHEVDVLEKACFSDVQFHPHKHR